MLYSYTQDSPTRPPDWRWRKITAYRDGSRRIPRSRSSDIISRLTEFNVALNNCRQIQDSNLLEFAEEELSYEFEDIFQAHKLYVNDTTQSYKWELEARLLTDQSYSEISKRMGISPSIVDMYEKSFFNVKDRLDCAGWVIHCVIGRSIHAGLSERDFDLLWKMFGYYSGPVAVDLMTNKLMLKKQKLEDRDQTIASIAEATQDLSIVAAFKSYAFSPINGFTAVNMIQVYQTFMQLKKEIGSGSDTAVIMQTVDNILSNLHWCSGSGTMERPVLTTMELADKRSSELRSDEAFKLANGDILQDIEDIRLPEPEEIGQNE
jgi:hypothetical protein